MVGKVVTLLAARSFSAFPASQGLLFTVRLLTVSVSVSTVSHAGFRTRTDVSVRSAVQREYLEIIMLMIKRCHSTVQCFVVLVHWMFKRFLHIL